MNVLVEKLRARNVVGTGRRHRALCLRKQFRSAWSAGVSADGFIDPVVRAEPQRVEFLRPVEVRARGCVAAEREFAARPLEVEFCKFICAARARLRRQLVEDGLSLDESIAAREGQAQRPLLLELWQFLGRERAMLGGERRAVPQVHRHRAHDDFRARRVALVNNRIQIFAEVLMHPRHARIIALHLLLEKHLHAAPLHGAARAEGTEPLHEAKLLHPQRRANKTQSRHLLPKHRAAAERSHHFVVAHVDDPHVAFQRPAVLRDFADDVRVDRGHGHVDDLELVAGKFQFEHRLQHPRQPKGRLRVPHGGRLAEDEDADRAGRLARREDHGLWGAGQAGGKKALAEVRIIREHLATVQPLLQEERRRMSHAREAQEKFHHRQQQQRTEQREHAERPILPARESRSGALGGRRFFLSFQDAPTLPAAAATKNKKRGAARPARLRKILPAFPPSALSQAQTASMLCL